MSVKILKLALAAGLLWVSPAQAHSPYLVPGSFQPAMGKIVTLDASFTEVFFVPDVAFNNDHYAIILPSGERIAPDNLVNLKTRVVLEHALDDKGTYRFTTGQRMGAQFYTYELNGKTKRARDPKEPFPEGARVTSHVQSITKAETYITLGAPNSVALKAYGTGLEIVTGGHPNEIYAGEGFSFSVNFEGKPLAEQKVELFAAGNAYSGKQKAVEYLTDAAGKVTIKNDTPGVYILKTRHRSPAPKGALAPVYSYTYTLTFDVAR